MGTHQKITQLLRLHDSAEYHSNEYKRLLGSRGKESKARCHLLKAEQLHSRISCFIRDFARFGPESGGKFPD